MEEPSTASDIQRCNMEPKMSDVSFSIFNDLRLEGEFCDVLIKVKDAEFHAHRNILCGCSPYFRALFSSRWNNSERQVYNIPGVTAEIMKLILEYAYTHTVPITVENVEYLLEAADQFNVLGIVRACCAFLEEQLDVENCIGIYTFAEFYSCFELQQRAHTFILCHFKEVAALSNEFLELTLPQLCDIVENDELNVKQENIVFEGILRWIAHSPTDRRPCITVLLPKVRLSLMDADYFMNDVKNNEIVKSYEECKPIIINAFKAMYDLDLSYDFQNTMTRPRLPWTILLAIGGWSGGSPTNCIEAYDIRADLWVNVTQDQESPRAYHGTAYLEGFMFVIGGSDGVNHFNSVRKVNPVTRVWQEVAPMYFRRCYVSVTVLGGFIYAIGGFDGYDRLNTVERYQPRTNQWTLISPMNSRRSDASATTLEDKIYICGGFNGNECLFSAEVYSPVTNQWTMIAPMRNRRSGLGVISYGDQVYMVGGFDGTNRLQSGEVYNPMTNSWSAIPNMFKGRSNFGIEVVDDLLFVLGGFNGMTTTYDVEYYNKDTNEWYKAHDMGLYRSALSCCVIPRLPNMTGYTPPRESPNIPRVELRLSASDSLLST